MWVRGTLAANLAAAERDDAAAQYAVGYRFLTGDLGVPQDFANAALWYRKAADQGIASAQLVLRGLYVSGKGVPQSDAVAHKWFRLASSQGEPGAHCTLGLFYEEGRGGLDADVDEAVRLYKLAAASGLSDADDNVRRLGFSPSGALICRTCFALPPPGPELQRCTGCKEAYYSGAACQRTDWVPRHRDECKALKARQAAQEAAMEAELATSTRRAAPCGCVGRRCGPGCAWGVLPCWREGPPCVNACSSRVASQGHGVWPRDCAVGYGLELRNWRGRCADFG